MVSGLTLLLAAPAKAERSPSLLSYSFLLVSLTVGTGQVFLLSYNKLDYRVESV